MMPIQAGVEAQAHANVIAFATLFLRPDLRVAAGGSGRLDRLPIADAHMEHLEFEARLCTPSTADSCANGGAANPNIARAQWERMLSATRLMRSNGVAVRGTEQTSAHIVQRYGRSNDNISSQAPVDAPPRSMDVAAFRMKRKLGTIDLAVHGTPFDVRIAASLELPIERVPSQDDVSERLLKRRWSFVFFGTLRCDFTKVEVLQGRKNTDAVHQVEIELLDAPSAIRNGISPAHVWAQIQELIAILAAAADGQRCKARYTLIRQRLQTRITI